MAKTIAGTTIGTGYALTNAAYTPFYVAAGAGITNSSGTALLNALGAGWSIGNAGLVAATGTTGSGVVAVNGGTLSNTVTGAISGYGFGVSIGGTGVVFNRGGISASQSTGASATYVSGSHQLTAKSAGVAMGGGTVVNYANASIASPLIGVALNGAGTLVNSGSIASGSGTAAGYGVLLGAGGSVTNQTGGRITAGKFGIADFGPFTVVNQTGATISAASIGISGSYKAGTITNQGSLAGSVRYGVYLAAGGTVTNLAGQISGGYGGVRASIVAATVSNQGTIRGTTPFASQTFPFGGVMLFAGGSIDNAAPGATIVGGRYGVFAAAQATLTNQGSITTARSLGGAAVLLNGGGSIGNASTGKITSNGYSAVIAGAAGTVTNAGTIFSTQTFAGAGLALFAGGTVTNQAGGNIASEWIGVQFGRANLVGNGTLVNDGVIQATDGKVGGADGAAVWLHGTSTVINNSSASIGGAVAGTVASGPLAGTSVGGFGIVAYYNATIVNRGTIGGGVYAVDFTTNNTTQTAGTGGLIEVAPGATFQGIVLGASNGNTLAGKALNAYASLGRLELLSGASTGTISGFGTRYRNFGNVVVDPGAQWNLAGTVGAETTLTFSTGGSSGLTLANPGAMQGTIANFRAGETLSLAGITTSSGLFPITMDSSDLLTLTGAGIVLHFDSSATGLTFSQSVSGGQTNITVSCFARGTAIHTAGGPVRVEELKAGGKVLTHRGEEVDIVWIGQRDVDCRRHPDPASVLPVRIQAWAFGRGVPSRDLLLSPDHAIYREGVLVPIRCLINGTSIRQETVAAVSYFHIELPEHDVILAENLPVESYLDTGDRASFANGGQPLKLFPEFSARRWEMAGCAPLVMSGPKLDLIKRGLTPRLNNRYTYY